jgi:hypothetical protein
MAAPPPREARPRIECRAGGVRRNRVFPSFDSRCRGVASGEVLGHVGNAAQLVDVRTGRDQVDLVGADGRELVQGGE